MAVWLVTGAGRGIGRELVRQLAQRGDTVIATVRPGTGSLPEPAVRSEALDVADPASAAALGRRLADEAIDVLVNNAGVRGSERPLGEVSVEEMERTYRVNAVGPLLVTQALLPSLRRGSRRLVVNVTSRMGSIEDNRSGSYYAYRASKAALNMITRSMAVDLATQGISAVVLHPGWVKTDMGGEAAPLEASHSVSGLLRVIDRLGPEDSGRFFDHTGEAIPW